jgi:ammonium transporter, Amt family
LLLDQSRNRVRARLSIDGKRGSRYSNVFSAFTSQQGAIAALAAVNTALAGGAGAVSGLLTNLYLEERRTGEHTFNLTMAMNGCLSGLVSITAGCGTVHNWAALVIGMVAGWIYVGTSKMLIRLRIDDAVDSIPVHLFNGAWGVFAVGLFSAPKLVMEAFGSDEHAGLLYSIGQGNIDFTLFGLQVLEIVFIAGWTTFLMLPFFLVLNYVGWLRVDSLEETVGLDTSYNRASEGAQQDEDVNDSDIQAFLAKKAATANRRRAGTGNATDDEDKSLSLTPSNRQRSRDVSEEPLESHPDSA